MTTMDLIEKLAAWPKGTPLYIYIDDDNTLWLAPRDGGADDLPMDTRPRIEVPLDEDGR